MHDMVLSIGYTVYGTRYTNGISDCFPSHTAVHRVVYRAPCTVYRAIMHKIIPREV
jgi:hypothetical protein